MSFQSQIDKEQQILDEQLANEEITSKEYSEAMNELMRDYQAAAEESAQQAYNREMKNW